MDNTYILYPDPFSITWVTEKALSHIHSNAAIAKSSDKRPWHILHRLKKEEGEKKTLGTLELIKWLKH